MLLKKRFGALGSRKLPKKERFQRCTDVASDIIVEIICKEPIRSVCIEDMQTSPRGNANEINWLHALVMDRLDGCLGDFPIFPSPTQVKKFAVGRGGSARDPVGKQEVMDCVLKLWGERFDDDNIADAYVLARIGMALRGANDWTLSEAQEAVLKQLIGAK